MTVCNFSNSYDPDVTLSVLSSHVEVTRACAEKKAFYIIILLFKQQMIIYREDSGTQSLISTVTLSFLEHMQDMLPSVMAKFRSSGFMQKTQTDGLS